MTIKQTPSEAVCLAALAIEPLVRDGSHWLFMRGRIWGRRAAARKFNAQTVNRLARRGLVIIKGNVAEIAADYSSLNGGPGGVGSPQAASNAATKTITAQTA